MDTGGSPRCSSASGGAAPVNAQRIYRLMKKHGLLHERHTGRRRPREHDGQVTTIRDMMVQCFEKRFDAIRAPHPVQWLSDSHQKKRGLTLKKALMLWLTSRMVDFPFRDLHKSGDDL